MTDSRIIRRYNAYYHGWCLAFGEHQADYREGRDINWLFGDRKTGLILSPELRTRAHKAFLGHHQEIPELRLSEHRVTMGRFTYPLGNDTDRANIRRLQAFLLGSREMHLFLCSHLFYPHARIITFAEEKPTIIMYKEMQPLRLIVD